LFVCFFFCLFSAFIPRIVLIAYHSESRRFLDMECYDVWSAVKALADSTNEEEQLLYHFFSSRYLLFDNFKNDDIIDNNNKSEKREVSDEILVSCAELACSLNADRPNNIAELPSVDYATVQIPSPDTSQGQPPTKAGSLRNLSIRSLKKPSTSISGSGGITTNVTPANTPRSTAQQQLQQQQQIVDKLDLNRRFFFQNALCVRLFVGGKLLAFHSLSQTWNPAIVCDIWDENRFCVQFLEIKLRDNTLLTPDMMVVKQTIVKQPHEKLVRFFSCCCFF
jgi:hypothetical protein